MDQGIELSDEMLDNITGGYIYHVEGTGGAADRYYLLTDSGKTIATFKSAEKAAEWAGKTKLTPQTLSAEEFKRLRETGTL